MACEADTGPQNHYINRNLHPYLKNVYQVQGNDQFTVKVADTLEDAIKLMEVGFEFHAEIKGHKLSRKRKYDYDTKHNGLFKSV